MQTLAYKVAEGLKRRTPTHPASIEVLQFSILVIINTLSTIIISLGISLITGKIVETSIAMLVFAILRSASGGLHLKNSWSCTMATSIVANIVAFIHYPSQSIIWITVISMLLALIYAPSNIEYQTKIPKKYFPLLKIISVLIIASNLFIGSSVIASAFLIQAILLIHVEGGEKNEN